MGDAVIGHPEAWSRATSAYRRWWKPNRVVGWCGVPPVCSDGLPRNMGTWILIPLHCPPRGELKQVNVAWSVP